MDFPRQEYRLREQGGSPPRSLLQEHAVPCGSELAREEAGAVDGLSASGIPPSRTRWIATPVAPTGARGTLWERACSRRVRCSRWISCVRNTAFANKVDRHPGRSYGSTRYLVGASLLAKSPVQSMDFLRQEYRLREQGGSPPRSLLQEHAVPCGSELAREGVSQVFTFRADPEQRQPDPQVQQALQQVPQVPGRADQARRRPHRQSPQFR